MGICPLNPKGKKVGCWRWWLSLSTQPFKPGGAQLVATLVIPGCALLGADPESSNALHFWIPGSRQEARPGMTVRRAPDAAQRAALRGAARCRAGAAQSA